MLPTSRRTVILETPETVALIMYCYAQKGEEWMAQVYLDGIAAAADAAADTVPHPWHLVDVTQHMAPQWDTSLPQPHVHLTVADANAEHAVAQWAMRAHDVFQTTLCRHVQEEGLAGVTLNTPWPPGWELTGLLDSRGVIGRHRCLPTSEAIYPAERVSVQIASCVGRGARALPLGRPPGLPAPAFPDARGDPGSRTPQAPRSGRRSLTLGQGVAHCRRSPARGPAARMRNRRGVGADADVVQVPQRVAVVAGEALMLVELSLGVSESTVESGDGHPQGRRGGHPRDGHDNAGKIGMMSHGDHDP